VNADERLSRLVLAASLYEIGRISREELVSEWGLACALYGNMPDVVHRADELTRAFRRRDDAGIRTPVMDERTHSERMRDAESDMCGDDEWW
jgi:hypothetical protein